MNAPLSFVSGLGFVAQKYGLDESVFLHEILHWCKQNKSQGSNFHDGRWWTYNTLQGLAELFPWWTVKQVRRIAESCRAQGALLAARYNEDPKRHTLWYSPSDELLAMYGIDWTFANGSADDVGLDKIGETSDDQGKCPNGQNDLPKRADVNAQMGKSLYVTGNNTGNKPPISPPQGDKRAETKVCAWKEKRFLRFWKFYRETFCAADAGRAGERARAATSWDKLRPDDETIFKMGAKLEAIMRTRQWQDGIGIQYASTFLNGVRMGKISLDDLPAPANQPRSDPPEPVREEDQWI